MDTAYLPTGDQYNKAVRPFRIERMSRFPFFLPFVPSALVSFQENVIYHEETGILPQLSSILV